MRGRGALLLTAVALAAALGLFLQRERLIAGSVGLSGFPLDDSWIHLQFARNLASGHGFAYNPDVPVAGSTAPLWTLLLAGLFKIGGAYPAWAKLAGVAAALGAAWLARWLALLWTGDAALGLTAGLATAWSAPMVWGALSGMEVTLAALLVTAALAAHTAGRVTVSAALAGLAVLARPESLLLVPLLWLAGPLTFSRSAIVWGVPVALLAPWVVFNLRTAGTPLPATAAAKVQGGLVGFLSGAREPLATTLWWRPWQFEREWIAWLASVNLLLPVLHRARALGVVAARRAVLVLARLHSPGPSDRHGPACALSRPRLSGGALLDTAPAAGRRGGGERLRPVLLGASRPAGVGTVGLRAPARRLARSARRRRDPLRLGRPEHRRHAGEPGPLGRCAHAARTLASRSTTLAPSPISDGVEVIDVMGLVTPAIIPYRRDGEAGVLRYLEQTCPDYLIVFPAWFPTLSTRADLFTPVHRVRLEHNMVAGADEMVVYQTAWNRWRAAPAACPVPSAGNSVGGGGGSLRGPR